MTSIVGRGIRVEIGMTEDTAKTVTAVTLADPGVATCAAHGLANKSVGYFQNVSGMVQLEGQSVRLTGAATNTFNLEDIDTSSYGAFTAGQFVPVLTWGTLGRTTGYDTGGGGSEKLDNTVLLDDVKQEVQGQGAAQSVTFNLIPATISDTAMTKLRKVARANGYLVFRITLKDGNVRHFRGQPSLPGESVQKGAIASGSFSVTVNGVICEGAA